MNLNIAQVLQTSIALTKLDANTSIHTMDQPELLELERGGACGTLSKPLITCLKDTAHYTQKMTRECILCSIASTKNSQATTCAEFDAEGYCDNCRECEEVECPTACWPEFETWWHCHLGEIGCEGLCGEEEDNALLFAIS
mmetsp:Transcript_41882/g.71650  ORF Transcript_41882/g.71650 Transcript_41882/m.71650 type:complete len:141 (+) Transcript_41882:64-486(+)|eukprot:CAMPEP_0183734960 /NCGR_PEP_ID=MMETSP0737-20130205/45319_1 /TAXON_ID=385413 /ORGANISM="Thalassiosira miniscula, Strain CCMP1093" /LENGTH=140 /DNA_ID=CAMNT_0025968587 /DNA_START=387 /DNA_END=809 /DNA_ORIENTATION=+